MNKPSKPTVIIKIPILLCVLFVIDVSSCEKEYKEEIFNDKYIIIYGQWKHIETIGGWNGAIRNTTEYTLNIYPIGKFSAPNIENGKILIIEQTESQLRIRFEPQLETTGEKYINFNGNDTMYVNDSCLDCYSSLYIRNPE